MKKIFGLLFLVFLVSLGARQAQAQQADCGLHVRRDSVTVRYFSRNFKRGMTDMDQAIAAAKHRQPGFQDMVKPLVPRLPKKYIPPKK